MIANNEKMVLVRVLVVTMLGFCLEAAAAHELYSPLSSLCCAGKVAAREADVSLCCGNTVYNPTEALCCSDKVLPLPEDPPGVSIAPLIPTGHFRPGGPVYFSARSVMYSCCGDSLYTVAHELCCDGKVVEKPSSEPGDMPTFFSCCGSEIYNVSGQDCCRGKVLPKTKVSEGCCGDQIVDYAEKVCCTEDFANVTETPVIHERDEPDVSCCGREKINFKNQICCSGKVVSVPDDPVERSKAACCGDSVWMTRPSEMCCDGKVLPRSSFDEGCCGLEVFNLVSHICCDGVVLPKKGTETYCCGSKTYEGDKDTCCFGNFTVVSLSNNLEDMACCE